MAIRRLSLGSLVAGALLLASACGDRSSASDASDDADPEATETDATEDAVQEVELAPLGPDGDAEALGDLLDGRPMVVNFFASWCRPCIEEMPDFEAVHQDLGDHVAFLGLAMQDGADQALGIVETTGVTYPTYADPDGAALQLFGGTNMPTTVFLSPDGEVLEVRSRALSEQALRDLINELFWER